MDSYRIGVSIALANGVSPVLAIISRDLLGIRGPIGQITKDFENWNKKLIGVAGILGGTAIIGALTKIASLGDKLLDQQDKLMRAGVAYGDVLKLQSTYYASIAGTVPTSTISEYLKTTNELRAVTGNTDEAAKLAPTAMMTDALLSNAAGHDESGQYYKLLRSAEMKGISTDPAKLKQYIDQVFSYIIAFGGKLSADDFQTLARRGGTAFMNATPEAIGPLAVLAADLGGSAAGTTLMTLQQLQMGATTLSKQQGATLADLGLLDMTKATPTGFGGSRLQLAPGAIKGSQEYTGNLPGWIHNVVYPALEKAAHGDHALLEALIAKLSPNRNAAKLIEMYGDEGFAKQQEKDLSLAGQVESIPDAYKHFTDRNPLGVKRAFNQQFESMVQAIGAPMMTAAIPVMKEVTSMFTAFGAFANSHPETIKILAEGVGALAVGLVGAGAATLIAIASIPAAITGVVAALGALAAVNWSSITGMLSSIASAIGAFLDALKALYSHAAGIFHNAPEGVYPGGTLRHPSNFHPGTDNVRAQNASFSLNIDGRTLAQTIIDHVDSLYRYDTNSPAFNGSGRYGA